MSDIVLQSTRGGQNDYDSPLAIADDQVVSAVNVEWTSSMLGERRLGVLGIDIAGSDLEGHERVTFLQCHTPSENEEEVELWAWGVSDDLTNHLCRKDTAWHTVTLPDAPDLSASIDQYLMQAQSLHTKNFLAYKSAESRLHVVDAGSNTARRAGLAAAAAPTGADTASVGTYAGTRYARVRYVVVDGSGRVLRRSNPSDVLTITPAGTKTGITFTKPAAISEGETHWELELSVDNANFYRFARTLVGTATVTDTTAYSPGYQALGADYPLSEAEDAYSLLPNAEFLVVDRDRLVCLGDRDNPEFSCRVLWTPVAKDDGVGNDERWDETTDPILDLDTNDGGAITGGKASNGVIVVFKLQRIYALSSSGLVERAYDVSNVSKTRGAIKGSVVEADDEAGDTVLYFIDPKVGPCRLGIRGVKRCGRDIRKLWKRVNLNAEVICRAEYYPDKEQVHWWIAIDGANLPNAHIVLHTAHTVTVGEVRKGWAVWEGASSTNVLATCLYPENIDDDTDRSLRYKPLIAQEGDVLISMTDTGDDDNGEEYTATQISKPLMRRNGIHKFSVEQGLVIGKAVTGAAIDVTLRGDFGKDEITREVSDISFTPDVDETSVIAVLDNLRLAQLRAVQIVIADTATPGARWELESVVLADASDERATYKK